ncbi:MAG TPA: flavodoxin, partial [Candidatus Limiplasma sp.]|nr:flavodoxin [Candidatus Limiplasma sp.]
LFFVIGGIADGTSVSAETATTLIVCFSRVGITDFTDDVDAISSASLSLGTNGKLIGNAQILAGYVKNDISGDLFQVITEQKYPSAYRETTDQALKEQDMDARPALISLPENLDQYDTVFLVYPNWWSTLPMPMFTFLESVDLSGKTIAPLCTHEGSGLGDSLRALKNLCPDSTILEGLAIRGGSVVDAEEEVHQWLQKLGFDE